MDTHSLTPAGTWPWVPTARRRDAVYRTLAIALAGWGLAPVASGAGGTLSAAETAATRATGVVTASPTGEEEGAVVPAGGLVASRRAAQCGGACGRADCQKCRGGKGCRHHGACGPEIPGCPAHCPVRPDRFGYYQTNWRRWPGQAVIPASFNDAAVPVSPPRSLVPGVDDEAGSPPEDDQAAADTGKGELPGPADGEGTAPAGEKAPAVEPVRPAAETGKPERAVVPETPPETPAEPVVPRKPGDELFEQSRTPQRPADTAPGRFVQWRAKQRPTPSGDRTTSPESSAAVQTTAAEPAAAANRPASVGQASPPSNPFRR